MPPHQSQQINNAMKKAPVWLISFTDVIALMLTFFVLLYAMSAPDIEKFDRKLGMTDSATASYSRLRQEAGADEGLNIRSQEEESGEDLDYLFSLLRENLADYDPGAQPIVRRQGSEIIIDLQAVMRQGRLRDLIPFFRNIPNQITVEGDIDQAGSFAGLQDMAILLMNDGYERPINLSLTSDRGLRLVIDSTTGRRIVE